MSSLLFEFYTVIQNYYFFVTSCVYGMPFGFEFFCLPQLLVLLHKAYVILQYYGAPSLTVM